MIQSQKKSVDTIPPDAEARRAMQRAVCQEGVRNVAKTPATDKPKPQSEPQKPR